MIISDGSDVVFEKTNGFHFPPLRQTQKNKQFFRTAAGGVYSSRVGVIGAFNRTKSKPIKSFALRNSSHRQNLPDGSRDFANIVSAQQKAKLEVT
jgi:hypothetical protein